MIGIALGYVFFAAHRKGYITLEVMTMSDQNEENALGKRYGVGSLIRFACPTMVMMLFNALYSNVDAIFVSRYVGTDALSAINIVMPFISLLWGLGTMFATGGSAMIAKKMGEKTKAEARRNFTAIIFAGSIFGAALTIVGTVFLDDIILALGATAKILPYGRAYLGVLMLFAPAVLVQVLFQNLFVTAGKPHLGLAVSIGAGLSNLVLDYLFIVVLRIGILGAAIGTGAGYCIAAIAGLLFFSQKKGTLHFSMPRIKPKELMLCCYNGSSELITQLAGENGVAAVTIIGNTQFLFTTLTMGFSMGVAPIISYQYGAQNAGELRRLLRLCLFYVACISAAVFVTCSLSAPAISMLYAGEGSEAYRLAVEGFRIFSFSFLFSGIGIFGSATFTALSNGKVSAILSFMRTFALLTVFLLVLPRIWGISGVWVATPMADFIGAILAVVLLLAYKEKYFGQWTDSQ